MHYIISILAVGGVAGFAAGFFLAPVPIIVLAVIAIVYAAVFFKGANDGPTGMSGGIGLALLSLLGPFFLFFWASVR